jgi:ribosomal protein L15
MREELSKVTGRRRDKGRDSGRGRKGREEREGFCGLALISF